MQCNGNFLFFHFNEAAASGGRRCPSKSLQLKKPNGIVIHYQSACLPAAPFLSPISPNYEQPPQLPSMVPRSSSTHVPFHRIPHANRQTAARSLPPARRRTHAKRSGQTALCACCCWGSTKPSPCADPYAARLRCRRVFLSPSSIHIALVFLGLAGLPPSIGGGRQGWEVEQGGAGA